MYAGVKIYDHCTIEKLFDSTGAIIIYDGFFCAKCRKWYTKVAQIGNVIVEDNVEIKSELQLIEQRWAQQYVKV